MLLSIIAVIAYCSLSVYASYALSHANSMTKLERSLFGLALIWHFYVLSTQIATGTQLKFGFANILSAAMLIGLAIFWVESLFIKIDGLRLLLFPLGAISCALPLVFSHGTLVSTVHSNWLAAHLIISLAAYSLLTICTLHALLMGAIDHQLRHPKKPFNSVTSRQTQKRFFDQLPPLLDLEKVLFRLILLGFVLLSLSILSGSLFSIELTGALFHFDHKTLLTLMSWVLFGILLLGHHYYGWRGRQALRWVYGGFICLFLAYAGSRFVLETLIS